MTPNDFDDVERHLEASSQAMADANAAILRGHEELVQAFRVSRHARGEQEDLRETVARLEGLVLDLVREVHQLRDRKNGGAQ
jgi:hypothetical protein